MKRAINEQTDCRTKWKEGQMEGVRKLMPGTLKNEPQVK